SGINLQTDNYFQYTSLIFFMSEKTPLRSIQNALAFFLKAFSGADEVFPDSHNSSVPTRAHVRVNANYIM
ncbi:hypothetical protein, partial [Phocaeicola plebeius]